MIGDRVKIGMGSVEVSGENVPVYELMLDSFGKVYFDQNNAATPKVIGGVKGGCLGKIAGPSVKVSKSSLVGGNVGAGMGVDYVSIIPVYIDYYQKTAYVGQDHCHIVGSYSQH